MKKYKQLNLEDRERIAILKAMGKSSRQIAKELGRSHSTIFKGIKPEWGVNQHGVVFRRN